MLGWPKSQSYTHPACFESSGLVPQSRFGAPLFTASCIRFFNLSGFGRWGEVFGDDVVAAAMIDRLVHHAEVVSMKGDSCRLKDRDLGRVPAATKTND